MTRAGVLATLVAVVIVGACGQATTAEPAMTPTTTKTVRPSASGDTTDAVSAPAGLPATHWSAIVADLQRRGAPTDAIQVVSAEAKTWPNGAWGCPKPGTTYTQALVQGYRVVLTTGDTTYDYRFGATATPRLCEY